MSMLFKAFFAISLALVALVSAASVDEDVVHFDGHQVLKASVSTKAQLDALKRLADSGKYDFWTEPRTGLAGTDIRTSPEQRSELLQFFADNGINYSTMIQDLERNIAVERARTKQANGSMNWDDYQTIDTIYGWLDELTAANPSLISGEVIGTSTEGRDVRVYKISTSADNDPTRPAFWIDATIHSREWISTTTITYIVNELVNNATNYGDILDSVDFYILPIVNPDGYAFTHSSNRLWRKTRSNYDNNTNPTCMGVDANRNFAVGFGAEGSSGDACQETHRGPQAYSEPETRAIKNYIRGKACTTNWTVFITLHSYSQLWMTPYGYSFGLPDNYDELFELATRAAATLQSVHGTVYEVGNSADILYLSAGSSRDWAHLEGGFRYVYTLELRDTGRHGFILPRDQIIPTAEETWAGIQVVAQHIKAN